MLLAGIAAGSALTIAMPDHAEFEANLHVPFRDDDARPVTMQFSYPGATAGTSVAWQIDLLNRQGVVLCTWQGQSAIGAGSTQAQIQWDGLDGNRRSLPSGYVRLRAIALDNSVVMRLAAA